MTILGHITVGLCLHLKPELHSCIVNVQNCFSLSSPGLNDREGRGRWEWAGGEPVTYTNWRKTPPRPKVKDSKKCVVVWRKAKWHIRSCKTSRGHHFVCSVRT